MQDIEQIFLKTTKVLNKFFCNIIKNIEISKFSEYEPFIDNLGDKAAREILTYKTISASLLFKINLKIEMDCISQKLNWNHWKRNSKLKYKEISTLIWYTQN